MLRFWGVAEYVLFLVVSIAVGRVCYDLSIDKLQQNAAFWLGVIMGIFAFTMLWLLRMILTEK